MKGGRRHKSLIPRIRHKKKGGLRGRTAKEFKSELGRKHVHWGDSKKERDLTQY